MAVVLVLLYVVRASHGLRHRWKFRDKMSLHRLHYQRGGSCTVYVGVLYWICRCTAFNMSGVPCRHCAQRNKKFNLVSHLISSRLN